MNEIGFVRKLLDVQDGAACHAQRHQRRHAGFHGATARPCLDAAVDLAEVAQASSRRRVALVRGQARLPDRRRDPGELVCRDRADQHEPVLCAVTAPGNVQRMPVAGARGDPALEVQRQEVDQFVESRVEDGHVDALPEAMQASHAQRGHDGRCGERPGAHLQDRGTDDRRRTVGRTGGIDDAAQRRDDPFVAAAPGKRSCMAEGRDVADDLRRRPRRCPWCRIARPVVRRQDHDVSGGEQRPSQLDVRLDMRVDDQALLACEHRGTMAPLVRSEGRGRLEDDDCCAQLREKSAASADGHAMAHLHDEQGRQQAIGVRGIRHAALGQSVLCGSSACITM